MRRSDVARELPARGGRTRRGGRGRAAPGLRAFSALALALALALGTLLCAAGCGKVEAAERSATAAPVKGREWEALAEAFLAKSATIQACLVIVDGRTVFEAYTQPRNADDLRKLNSVTKSVLSLLVGIALDEGKLASPDAAVASFFPEAAASWPAGKKRLTLRHLLEMTDGLEWSEDGSYAGPTDSFTAMWASPDPARYVLDRPLAAEPGSRFRYNSGASHLLSAILQKAVGENARDYAAKKLFAPLGIEAFHWGLDRTGAATGSHGLYLRARDLAKIGQLCLARGLWEGKRIVSASWIELSTSKKTETPNGLAGRDGYGLHWWMNPSGGYSGRGYGGQYLFVDPARKLVAVVFGANYGYDFYLPERLMTDRIAPAADATGPGVSPASARRLREVEAEVAAPPREAAPPPPPALAATISGKKIRLSDGSVAGFDFADPREAVMSLATGGPAGSFPLGLDGRYRRGFLGQAFGPIPPNPVYARGGWEGEDLFRAEILLANDNAAYVFRFRFLPGGKVEESCYVPELGREIERLEGRLE